MNKKMKEVVEDVLEAYFKYVGEDQSGNLYRAMSELRRVSGWKGKKRVPSEKREGGWGRGVGRGRGGVEW